jgi:hypothetical protein
MTSDDAEDYRRRTIAYEATRGEPGFDEQKLHDMVNACALRQELGRTDYRKGAPRPLEMIHAPSGPRNPTRTALL